MTETYYTPDRDFLIREFRDNPEYTLHTAVVHGNLPQIRELLTADYDINKLHDHEGSFKGWGTPLHVAIWSNQPAAFELLIIRGADINLVDIGHEMRSPDTPIRVAVRLGRRAMFKRLWDLGAERNKYPSNIYIRRSLVEVAACDGQAHILRDLLHWDESWTEDQRIRALILACNQGHILVITTLLVECAYSTTVLENAISAAMDAEFPLDTWCKASEHEKKLKQQHRSMRLAATVMHLLDEHSRVGSADGTQTYDCSALLNQLVYRAAASQGDVDVLRLVLAKGADPNIVGREGNTPLHKAMTRWGHGMGDYNEKGVIVLLENGAEVDIQNEKGETAGDIANRERKYKKRWVGD